MSYVASLQDKRRQVWAELESLREEQRRVGEALGVKEAQLKNIDELLAMEDASASVGRSDTQRTFLDAAEEVVRGARPGIHYKVLLEQLNAHGVNVPGRDPGANLLAHLGRDDRFIRVGRGTYGISGTHKEMRARRRTTRKRARRPSAP